MMDAITAAHALGARLVGDNVAIGGVSTDSRAISEGELFFALEGERFDGHAFVRGAFERGAAAAVVRGDAALDARGTLLAVADTRLALAALARYWRARFAIPVIAITGSNGKTTVKEMTAAILRARYGADRVLATAGNFNNDIGLPLTVMKLRAEHRAAVLEIGMNHPGETAELAPIAAPSIALVNNAQREHQEFMNGVEAVAREHATIFDALPQSGVAVFNADDAHAHVWRDAVRARNARGARIEAVAFALDRDAEVRGHARDTASGTIVTIVTRGGSVGVRLRVSGRHNARNALAAAAAALAAGATLDAVHAGLESFEAVAGRLQTKRALNGATVIDDTYNANPDSVRAAIDVLASRAGRRYLVLGDMGEVGASGPEFHREIGACAKAAGIDVLIATGELSLASVDAFGGGAVHCADVACAIGELQSIEADATVLVKGSRFMRMERVVAALTGESPPGH